MLTDRNIRITPERRDTIDFHNLGRALLRLAQEQYDATVRSDSEPSPSPSAAPERAHGALTRPKAAPWPTGATRPPGRTDGRTA